jgi:uncharacterized membrane protein
MTKLCVGLLGVALLVATGCHPGTTGGPGVPGGSKSFTGAPGENAFRLDMPNLATKVKQGETKAVSIGIDRGKNFDQDVTLAFENLPKGVTVEPPKPVIKHGDKEVSVTIHTAEDAAVGDFTIKVDGQPAKGDPASNTFKLTVDKK